MAGRFTTDEMEILSKPFKVSRQLIFYVPPSAGSSSSWGGNTIHEDSSEVPTNRVIDWGRQTTEAYGARMAKPGNLSAGQWQIEVNNSDGFFNLDKIGGAWANGSFLCPPSVVRVAFMCNALKPRGGGFLRLQGAYRWQGAVISCRFSEGLQINESGGSVIKPKSAIIQMEPIAVKGLREVMTVEHGWETATGYAPLL